MNLRYADQLSDLSIEFVKIYRESDPEKKKELQEKLANEIAPVQLKFFEDRLAKSGSGFIAASGLTWIDIYLYSMVDAIPQTDQVLRAFPNIKASREKVEANPGISAWLKVRPAI